MNENNIRFTYLDGSSQNRGSIIKEFNKNVDRVYRMGQNKTVNVYRLITKGTIEEKMQALQQKKQALL